MVDSLPPPPPPSGTPLSTLPVYGGAGGSDLAAKYYAGQSFSKTFGRNPTEAEVSLLYPSYLGDPNIANLAGGDQAVAAYYFQAVQAQKATAVPNTQAADNMDSSASGIYAPTTTPGGSPTSFASKYSYGSAPVDFAAPPSDNSSLIVMGLGAAVILYFTVFKHG